MLKHKSKSNKKNFLKPPPNLLRKLSCRGWSVDSSSSRASSSGEGSSKGSYTANEASNAGDAKNGNKVKQEDVVGSGGSLKSTNGKVVRKSVCFHTKKNGFSKAVGSSKKKKRINGSKRGNSDESTKEVHFVEQQEGVLGVENNARAADTTIGNISCEEDDVIMKMVTNREKEIMGKKKESNVGDDYGVNVTEDKTKFR